jgi:hypothetical protein
MRSAVDQNSIVVKSPFDRILSAPRKSEGERHKDILYRTGQLIANQMPPEEAIAAVQRIYPEKPIGDIARAAEPALKGFTAT